MENFNNSNNNTEEPQKVLKQGSDSKENELINRSLIERIIKRPIKQTNRKKYHSGDESTKYSPWSREKLLERLQTYSYKNWNVPGTNTLINASECAKYGWTCVEAEASSNTIQCVYCFNLLNVNLGDDSMTDEVRKIMSEKYRAKMIKDAHKSSCLWINRPSDDSVYDMLSANYHQRELFDKRLSQLAQISDKLGSVVIDDEEINSKGVELASKLAILGWRVDTVLNNGVAMLQCEACFRRVTICQDKQINLTDGQHMAYCPYNNPTEWKKLLIFIEPDKYQGRLTIPYEDDEDAISGYKERISNIRQMYFRR